MLGPISGVAELNLNRTQGRLADDTRRIASGLRVQTAADDPSGLAIAESLQSVVNGLDAGSESVQAARNALTVADGALQTATEIVQRIRALTVEAGNGINSAEQLQSIQDEIGQLVHELDRIAQNTSFNGRALLDGSLDTSPAVSASVTAVTPPASLGTTGLPPATTTASGKRLVSSVSPAGSPVDGYFIMQLVGVSGTTYTIRFIQTSSDPSVLLHTHDETGTVSSTGAYTWIYPDPAPDNRTEINFQMTGGLTAADVGLTAAYRVLAARPAGAGQAASVAVGDAEGDTVAISAPDVSAASLGLANLSVLPGTVTNGSTVVASTDNSWPIYSDLGELDDALVRLGSDRARLGAQMVALDETRTDAANASVQLQSSESAIRDLNVGMATTALTKDQILSQVGTAVLAQSNGLDRTILTLFR